MNKEHVDILIVDDEGDVRAFLKTLLTSDGYTSLREASSGEKALEETKKKIPSLMILDLGLPGIDGLTVLSEVRRIYSVPILILSVRNQEDDKVKAFELGADDYLTKPFGPRELLARLRVLLQRNTLSKPHSKLIEIGRIQIDIDKHTVLLDGKNLKMTDIEYKLLLYMARSPGKLFTHRELLKEIWGGNYVEHIEYLRVYIGHLRQKIEVDQSQPRIITTEAGIGYRFSAE